MFLYERLQISKISLNRCLLIRVDLVTDFLQCIFYLEDCGFSFILRIDAFLALAVLRLKSRCFLDSPVDFSIGHIGGSCDRDVLLLAGSEILCGYVHDTVRIDVECNLDLRNTASCRRDTIQSELSEGLVVRCELSLALKNIDIDRCLIIGSRGEYLALLERDRRISLDQACRNTALCLDGQGKRSDVQKKDIACAAVARELAALDGSTDRNAFIRIQGLAGLEGPS